MNIFNVVKYGPSGDKVYSIIAFDFEISEGLLTLFYVNKERYVAAFAPGNWDAVYRMEEDIGESTSI